MKNKQIIDEITKNINILVQEKKLKERICIFGRNPYVEDIIHVLYERDIRVEGILDNDTEKQGKLVLDVPVMAPDWLKEKSEPVTVLIASQYYEAMYRQLKEYGLTEHVAIYQLFDFISCSKTCEAKRQFWREENLHNELTSIQAGFRCYASIRRESGNAVLVISPTVSIGDNFLWRIYFDAYKDNAGLHSYQIIVPSKGAEKIMHLFKETEVTVISPKDMSGLVNFVIFMGETNVNCLLIYPRHKLVRCYDIWASWKNYAWSEIYKRLLFQLKEEEKGCFPDLRCKSVGGFAPKCSKPEMIKGKSVILSPYANTVDELAPELWECIAKWLIESGYRVYTNVVGNQKPVKYTGMLEIPLEECISYLEYAGTFIALRNGLCDVVGKAECAQIIFVRNRRQLHTSELEYNDLHKDGVSKKAQYILYDESSIENNLSKLKGIWSREVG